MFGVFMPQKLANNTNRNLFFSAFKNAALSMYQQIYNSMPKQST